MPHVPQPRFQFVGGSLALDFVNTVGDRLGRPRDTLRSLEDVGTWASQARLLRRVRGLEASRPRDLGRVIAARERLYGLLLASVKGRSAPSDGLAWLNDAVGACERRRRLVSSAGGLVWSWAPGLTLADLVVCAAVRDAVDLLTRRDQIVLSECADEHCGWLFLDDSPGGRRKWCSMADCGNRAKARRHYRRARTTPGA